MEVSNLISVSTPAENHTFGYRPQYNIGSRVWKSVVRVLLGDVHIDETHEGPLSDCVHWIAILLLNSGLVREILPANQSETRRAECEGKVVLELVNYLRETGTDVGEEEWERLLQAWRAEIPELIEDIKRGMMW